MKQLGNLAVVCARRTDVRMEIRDGRTFVCAGSTVFSAAWDDDAEIESIIRELNYGKCREDA